MLSNNLNYLFFGQSFGRFTNTFEGHEGTFFYYLIVLPFLILPYLIDALKGIGKLNLRGNNFELFLFIWFVFVLIFFSFSSTKLPHYILYGITPLAYVIHKNHLRISENKISINSTFFHSIIWLVVLSIPFYLNYLLSIQGSYDVSNEVINNFSNDLTFIVPVLCLIGMNLSRIAEELILWSSNGFNFIVINEEYTTGSSIMPQKRNPDAAELIRGKSNRLVGNLVNLTNLLKGLPLAYSKDLQEDKEPVFDSSENIKNSLLNMIGIIKSLKIKKNKMLKALQKGFPTATDLADYLVTYLNIPFRDAHKITGKIILLAEKKNCSLDELSLEDLRSIEPKIDSNIIKSISINSSILKKTSFGGTSPRLVLKAISDAKRRYL